MRKIVFIVLLCVSFLSCKTITIQESQSVSISEGVVFTINTYMYNLKKVNKDNKRLVPIQSDQRIFSSSFQIDNNSQESFEPLFDSVIELAVCSPDGDLHFYKAEDPFSLETNKVTLKSIAVKKPVGPGSTAMRDLYFVYDKEDKPVFITVNRTEILDLDFIKDSSEFKKMVGHHTRVEELVAMAQTMSFEDLSLFMSEHTIDIDETDSRNYTMLFSSIVFHNNTTFDALLLRGADYKKEVIIEGFTVNPLFAAVLSCNQYALDVLLSKGLILEDLSGNSPAALAVKTQNLQALYFLKDRDFDFSVLKVRDDVFTDKLFSPAMYAKRNSYKDIELFFSSLEK